MFFLRSCFVVSASRNDSTTFFARFPLPSRQPFCSSLSSQPLSQTFPNLEMFSAQPN